MLEVSTSEPTRPCRVAAVTAAPPVEARETRRTIQIPRRNQATATPQEGGVACSASPMPTVSVPPQVAPVQQPGSMATGTQPQMMLPLENLIFDGASGQFLNLQGPQMEVTKSQEEALLS